MPPDGSIDAYGHGPSAVRYFRSAYLAKPVIYVQEEDEWRSLAPGGHVQHSPGRLPESVLSQVFEIDEAQAWELINEIRLQRAAATAERDNRGDPSLARRDTLLGIAGLVIALHYLLLAAAMAVFLRFRESPLDASAAVAGGALDVAGLLLMATGLAVAGVAFLGGWVRKATGARWGVLVAAVGALARTVAGSLTESVSVVGVVLAPLIGLALVVPLLLVAGAYASDHSGVPRRSFHERNALFHRAARWLAAFAGLALVGDVLMSRLGSGIGSVIATEVSTLVSDVLWLAAMWIAVHAFAEAAGRSDRSAERAPLPPEDLAQVLATRDHSLSNSAVFYLASAGFIVVTWAIWLGAGWPAAGAPGAYAWLRTAVGASEMVAGVLAVMALRRSRLTAVLGG